MKTNELNNEPWFSDICTDLGRLSNEAAKRKKAFNLISVHNNDVQSYLDDGWEIEKGLKFRTHLKKNWTHDERLENRVWQLFYLMGYPELSASRNFQVKIQRKGEASYKKQIDVMAKDDETVVIVECKSSAKISKRSLQKDIEEMNSLKGPIVNAIKKHYGTEYKPKILWLIVTNNIAWSEPDKQRALSSGIHKITEKELRYYLQIADHLRSAARYQFLAEFLQNHKIPEMDNIKVPAVKGKLGGKIFYSFASTPKQMLKIAFVNHRSLNDPAGAPSYQRLVSRTRLSQISRFIKDGGYFPTNILVNFTEKCKFDRIAKDEDTNITFGQLYLPCKYRSAWIIDGQHRLYGYAPLTDDYMNQNIMVIAFEGLKKEEEANLFVTINHEQKSVPKTLLDDLEGELKWGSEKPSERIGAISARLIGLLNSDLGEPLYGRVTQQGIAATESTCLTVPALKDGLRRSGLVGRSIMKNKDFEPGPLCDSKDIETLERARCSINTFLQLIVTANPNEWELGRRGHICTNVSLQAYFYLFSSLIGYMESNKGLNSRELTPNELIAEIEEYIDPLLTWLTKSTSEHIEKEFKVPYGSGGPREYFYRLCHIIRETFSDFSPDGMDEWISEQSEDRIVEADRKLKELNIQVQKSIFDALKRKYGTENDRYWNRGVVDKSIKTNAYMKSLDDDDEVRLSLENYLDFIEYKKIVENKLHWNMFKPIFDIPQPGEKGISKNLRWMDRINELRRIPAHATEKRSYKIEDFEYIDFIYETFMERIESIEINIDQEVHE